MLAPVTPNCRTMRKISNVTNDPQSICSRVFVGNLNTFVLVKEDVERVFRRYGTISAISMHKGYAFIQYARPADARNACLGEDQRVYASQALGKFMYVKHKLRQYV